MAKPTAAAVNTLTGAGYAPLAAMILAARGMADENSARAYLCCDAHLPDPYLMKDMDLAAGRVGLAMSRGEKIAVFGDYDVDGITATCLLTDFLRSCGCEAVPYIPGRLEEGYGLNPIALRQLAAEGVKLIVTVDCGITAVEEAMLCKELGMELVITDHHECKQELPDAVAVVDPHRPDATYPHKGLSGVGVAFKLASALCGDQQEILRRYADMVCLGTIADVMPLEGENRVFVAEGLKALRQTERPGLAALMKHSACDQSTIGAANVGYVLAPRINAAGRMGQIHLAVELFLTKDPAKADELAMALCDLNRHRQEVEQEIYRQAVEMLPKGKPPQAIVLADETWHQGVVGIVASRIAEEYCCPTFLICLDGEHGKASSRSYGGFNLFSALSELSELLESYGGHELAAGFTINRQNIATFREAICAMAEDYYDADTPRTVLEADCAIGPDMLTVHNVESLESLEPCGNGCPKPQLVTEGLQIERLGVVGNGRHLRLRLRKGRYTLNAIWFSTTPEGASVAQGDTVDIAYTPQINDYRGERSVQLNIADIRPTCKAPCSHEASDYRALCAGTLNAEGAKNLIPDRSTLGMVWRYLASGGAPLSEEPMCLCRKIVRWADTPLRLGVMLTCLDVFRDVGLIEVQRRRKQISIRLLPHDHKADLNQSATMQKLMALIN